MASQGEGGSFVGGLAPRSFCSESLPLRLKDSKAYNMVVGDVVTIGAGGGHDSLK